MLWGGFITVWWVKGGVLTNLLLGLTLGSALGSLLLSGLALLEKGLRDQDLVLGRDATVENVLVGPQGACHEGSLAPSEELRRSGLALMHSPLSTLCCLCAIIDRRRLCWVSPSMVFLLLLPHILTGHF